MQKLGPISSFIENHFLHFNAASVVDASKAYTHHLENSGKMLVTLAGAMSTAELGKSLAEMIRQDKVHAICCTGANLEEDIFNLVAHNHYKRVPNYRDLTPKDENELYKNGFNRVTDTCIPEEEAMRKIEAKILGHWKAADLNSEVYPPHKYLWKLFETKEIQDEYQINIEDSWMYAAYEKDLPIFTPGWEDSTLGNICVSNFIKNKLSSTRFIETGLESMQRIADWYQKISKHSSIGFFQIGGGIAGDFPICVVPMIEQDLGQVTKKWGYFCQISDSTTSYGSYSGAVPNEKITWGKLEEDTPRYVIESDATIVAPLIFAHVLNW